MNEEELKIIVQDSLVKLLDADKELFVRDISERCLTARWMLHLQPYFNDLQVDVEFNREGALQDPKRLDLENNCANRRNINGKVYVLPDLIIHQRCPEGQNLFVAEVKKTTNATSRDCDQKRIEAFMREFGYQFGAIIEFETRKDHTPAAEVKIWY